MAGSGGDLPPFPAVDGGEFLLSLLQRIPQDRQQTPAQSVTNHRPQQPPLPLDPSVAALGPSVNFSPWSSNGSDLLYPSPSPPWLPHETLSSPLPPNFLGFQHPQNPFPPIGNQFSGNKFAGNQSPISQSPVDHGFLYELRKLGFGGDDSIAENNLRNLAQQQDIKLKFGSFSPTEAQTLPVMMNGTSSDNSRREAGFGRRSQNGLYNNHVTSTSNLTENSNLNANLNAFRHANYDSPELEGRGGGWGKGLLSGNSRSISSSGFNQHLPGFPGKPKGVGSWELGNLGRRGTAHIEKGGFSRMGSEANRVNKVSDEDGHSSSGFGLGGQLDCPGPPAGSSLHSVPASDIEESILTLHKEVTDRGSGDKYGVVHNLGKMEESANKSFSNELDDTGEQLVDSLLHEDECEEKNESKHHRREKDSRGNRLLTQRMRFFKRQMQCRVDIDRLNAPFLAIYQSLIPPEEEKAKQKQLMTLLENIVIREWPQARLFLYGSCANSFGVSKSDIDVCLALEDADINKSEVILRLADILQTDNLQNVQALTRARVPIVKLMDPGTGLSCDICINNVLAVINTKLLRDYAQIDVRLRQLAFIVKHWAKSRGVNETYQGTLSSYAYVLMCIHFLQQRRPPILPCLQEMVTTYSVTVEDIRCTFFDQVDQLRDFGSRNKEPISRLVWAFFNYWAYQHDYANNVISVRTGSIISKREKDWTRRIGNDRHLICIEDPFETSHDLGRVVDKYSIKVLREEFERAAEVLQYDPNPCVKLFERYVPQVY